MGKGIYFYKIEFPEGEICGFVYAASVVEATQSASDFFNEPIYSIYIQFMNDCPVIEIPDDYLQKIKELNAF